MKSRQDLSLAGQQIPCDIYTASAAAASRAVVVAYGTEGMNQPFGGMIDAVSEEIAKAGFLVVLPHYFKSSNTPPGLHGVSRDISTKSAVWIKTIESAVEWSRTACGGGNVGLVGFSLGGNMALNVALQGGVTAVVDYFGPVDRFGIMQMPTPPALSLGQAIRLPTVQIHHGTKDLIVPIAQSESLKSWLDIQNLTCEFHKDYACGHPGQPDVDWMASATVQGQSTQRTTAFLSNKV